MLGLLLCSLTIPVDTAINQSLNLDEVVVVSKNIKNKQTDKGMVATIDEHLAQLSSVNLIRRGAYAWEPVVNNMQTERISTTIDGMKIFYACTDKMDPVTSYVESGNLKSVSLNSGLDGNPQATGNIGGSLDLKLRKEGFDSRPYRLGASVGYETNGDAAVYGLDAALSTHRFYTNGGVFYRRAGNYKTGGGETVDFSQFSKINFFVNAGVRLDEKSQLESTLIYDKAWDVGYPALNMDVKKAEAFIASLSYKQFFNHPALYAWETKLYYNRISHVMDDTKRPEVEIHMDMPGKSATAGVYSLLQATFLNRHDVQLNVDAFTNRLFADMTMYPGGAAPMYMVTWPDVRTNNTGAAAIDNISLSQELFLKLSAKVAMQWQKINNEEGYHALSVFFPGMKDHYHQTTGRIAAALSWVKDEWTLTAGSGWGSRAPSVTEAYGYYLNNTFDQYDYIGNPRLKNESAVELNGKIKWNHHERLTVEANANVFLFSNYIIGKFEDRLSAMTVDAEGVKVYGNTKKASVINSELMLTWNISNNLKWNNKLAYSLGNDDEGDPLPLIAPVIFSSRMTWNHRQINAGVEMTGNARHSRVGEKYGEKTTPAFVIVNLFAKYAFKWWKVDATVRAGVENLFDKRYASYADWNYIPRKGRNIYVNLALDF